MSRVKIVLVCRNCGKNIYDPYRRDQMFCPNSNCSRNYSARICARIKNKTKPENYLGYNWGKKKK